MMNGNFVDWYLCVNNKKQNDYTVVKMVEISLGNSEYQNKNNLPRCRQSVRFIRFKGAIFWKVPG